MLSYAPKIAQLRPVRLSQLEVGCFLLIELLRLARLQSGGRGFSNMPECIDEVRSWYDKAEGELKRYERITLTNLAPAINQLRYAGHHLLKAADEKDEQLRDLNVLAAKRHSERALWDIREATVVFLLDEFDRFRDEFFTEDELSAAMPDWQEFLQKISDGRASLERAGVAKHFGDDVLSTIDGLLDVRDKMQLAMPKLSAMREKREIELRKAQQRAADEEHKERMAKEKAKEKKSDRIAVLGILLSIASILLAIVALGPIRRLIFNLTGINL